MSKPRTCTLSCPVGVSVFSAQRRKSPEGLIKRACCCLCVMVQRREGWILYIISAAGRQRRQSCLEGTYLEW